MQPRNLLLFLMLGAPDLWAQSSDRTAAPPIEKERDGIPLQTRFDLVAAKRQMEEGTNSITGTVCAFQTLPGVSGTVYYGSGVVVRLLPYDAHIAEAMKLRERHGEEARILFDETVEDVLLEATANENGQFRFSKLKPGRYFLSTLFEFTAHGVENVPVGQTREGSVIVNHYQERPVAWDYAYRIRRVVDVSGDGRDVRISMIPKRSMWNINSGGGGILDQKLGCPDRRR